MDLQQQLGEWYPLLSHVFETEWMQKLGRRMGALNSSESRRVIQPILDLLFRAFTLCPPSKVKVVIIGQDPYIRGEADGLAFSSFGRSTPSLEVIFDEINRTHICKRTQTHLDDWAAQGVFLLNTVLTTEMGKSKAHEGWGWENFTIEVLSALLNRTRTPIVYMLWGRDAQALFNKAETKYSIYEKLRSDLKLRACHPQAQNYNPANKFVGCNHFIEANLFLMKYGVVPISWSDPMPRYTAREINDMAYEWHNYLLHLKQLSHAEINIAPFLYSYPAVPDKPHPFDTGLQQQHQDTLPF